MDKVTIAAGCVGLLSIVATVVVKDVPLWVGVTVVVLCLAVIAGQQIPEPHALAPFSIALYSIGIAGLSGGVTYQLTDAHWKGREFYIPNLDRMILGAHSHIESLAFAVSDADYATRQTAAFNLLKEQASWVNKNFGGATARALINAAPTGECTDNPKFSETTNKNRCQYIRLLRGRLVFLEQLKAAEKWPQSPKEIVKDPHIYD